MCGYCSASLRVLASNYDAGRVAYIEIVKNLYGLIVRILEDRMCRRCSGGLAATIVFAALLFPPSAMAEPSPDCAKTKGELASVDKAIAQLEKSQLPGKLSSDLLAVLDELIDGLKGTKGDLGKITGSVSAAKSKLGDIAKNLKDAKVAVPPGFANLTGALDKMAQGIEAGVKKYEGGSVGKTAAGLTKAQGYINTAVGQLQSVRDQIAQAQTLDNARNGSAADQVRALQLVIDETKKVTGADKVPGVGDFLNAYSTAVGGIANNVASIEASMKKNISMANEALKGTDLDNGDIYLGQQTVAEQQAAALQALQKEKAKLQQQLAHLDCDKPPPPQDPCTHKKLGSNADTADQTRKLVARMTQKLQNEFDSDKSVVADAMYDALQNAMARPRAANGESQASYNARVATWQSKQDRLDAELKLHTAERDAAKAALDNAVGNAIAQEAAAKNWSAEDEAQFDECFPPEGKLRQTAKARGVTGKGSATTGTTGKKKPCTNTGGLAGAINQEACQIGQ
jgi:DNA repair exonuclease SbcCD ATPase subunit